MLKDKELRRKKDRRERTQANGVRNSEGPAGRSTRAADRSNQERQKENELRAQLVAAFPSWDMDRSGQRFFVHIGPTNSGKTYASLSNLITAGSGWYLAPLRLLAHEVFDTLNGQGVPCNLLTGEEVRNIPGAQITAATVEMFNPHRSGQCVLIDEVHMLADPQRGWAWTRALMEAAAPEVHLAGSPICEALLSSLLAEMGAAYTIERYKRLTPLAANGATWRLDALPARTILVAFSRRTVLALKSDLEHKFNRTVSVVYGNLPPEVRLRQAGRFAAGETEICVATDAIGMGLNLPADNVCFFETEKYDGSAMRQLTVNEILQIAGRAGRYGLSEKGMVGALAREDLAIIQSALKSSHRSIEYAFIAPTPESIALLPGSLSDRLQQWEMLSGIPLRWRELVKTVNLDAQTRLAGHLRAADVRALGLNGALQLISAPSDQDIEDYWLACATAIIHRQEMPDPIGPIPAVVTDERGLARCEYLVRRADLYLWLSNQDQFAGSGPRAEAVRAERDQLSRVMDEALAARIDATRRCKECGRLLPLRHRYNICERCFRGRRHNNPFDNR